MRKPNFETSSDTAKCVDYLRGRSRVPYHEISQYLGRDVQRRDRHVLENARRKLERESIVFVVETGVGLVRAVDSQIAMLSTSLPIEKIRRTTHRAQKRERVVNTQALTEDERAAFYVGRAILGAIRQATREAFRHQINGAVVTNPEPLSLEQTLSLFSKLRTDRAAQ